MAAQKDQKTDGTQSRKGNGVPNITGKILKLPDNGWSAPKFQEDKMNSFSYTFPVSCKCFSLCDAEIDTIICKEDTVKFVFSNGFYRVEKEQLQLTTKGYVEFCHGSAAEFTCHIVNREASAKGSILHGYPISLTELADMLSKEGRKIELFLELYDFNNLLWRGVLLPHKAHGLSDHVVIETSGCFPMTYFWE